MSDLISYLLKANIALTLFCLGYYLWLGKLTFYGLNRYYLIFSLLFSGLSPFFKIDKWLPSQQENVTGLLLNLSDWQQHQLPQEAADATSLFPGLYWFTVGLFTLFFLVKLAGIARIYWKSVPAHWGIFHFRRTAEEISPFSFWPHIYFNPSLFDEEEYEKIFRHEKVHIRDLHSLDILLAEIVLIFLWYNPFCWMIRKAVQDNIEFLTDDKVLASGIERKSYQYSLVNISNLSPSILGNPFNFKNLKKRIHMMNRKQSSKMELGKYALLLPAIVAASLVFGVSNAYTDPKASYPQENELIISSDTLKQDQNVVVIGYGQQKNVNLSTLADTLKQDKKGVPLYVIDGKKRPSLDGINPEQIYAVDVIKGENALAAYGEDGKNGVIEVTMKKLTGGDSQTVATREEKQVNTLDVKDLSDNVLIIVDGKKTPKSSLNQLSPDDIESISVLKGESAIDQFGDLGKDRVIEIITKEKN